MQLTEELNNLILRSTITYHHTLKEIKAIDRTEARIIIRSSEHKIMIPFFVLSEPNEKIIEIKQFEYIRFKL